MPGLQDVFIFGCSQGAYIRAHFLFFLVLALALKLALSSVKLARASALPQCCLPHFAALSVYVLPHCGSELNSQETYGFFQESIGWTFVYDGPPQRSPVILGAD